MEKKKKNIAVIIPGGIGTGHNNAGVPVLEQIVKLLSKEYSVIVFSLFKVNADCKSSGFELISIPSKNTFLKCFQFLR